MASAFRLFDLATQPRFILPLLFPILAYLGWYWERVGRLRNYLLAVLVINVGGFLLAMALEAQPLPADLINTLQGVALLFVAVAIYGVWRWRGWSTFVQGWALVAAVSVALWLPARTVFTLSGGVLIPIASFVYLARYDRRLAPLLFVGVFRIVVGVVREGFTALDVVVALTLAVAAVRIGRMIQRYSTEDTTSESGSGIGI